MRRLGFRIVYRPLPGTGLFLIVLLALLAAVVVLKLVFATPGRCAP